MKCVIIYYSVLWYEVRSGHSPIYTLVASVKFLMREQKLVVSSHDIMEGGTEGTRNYYYDYYYYQ